MKGPEQEREPKYQEVDLGKKIKKQNKTKYKQEGSSKPRVKG